MRTIQNPLDPESSWSQKPYGRGNYLDRPSETRSKEGSLSSSGNRQLSLVICDAGSLFREQIEEALESEEKSPDSIERLADLIGVALSGASNAVEARERLGKHQALLLWALALYDRVPDDYKFDSGKNHPTLIQLRCTAESLIQSLEGDDFVFEVLDAQKRVNLGTSGLVSYNWENAARMLQLVAKYLDETARSTFKKEY